MVTAGLFSLVIFPVAQGLPYILWVGSPGSPLAHWHCASGLQMFGW